MTEKESIKIEKYILDGYKKPSYKLAEKIMEVVEKQIPKKPKERQGTTYSFCPCCDSNNIYEYCGDCGQKIDWSDIECQIKK